MRERAQVRYGGRSCCCRAGWILLASASLIAPQAALTGATAQTIAPDWLRPSLEADPSQPPLFQRQELPQNGTTNRFNPLPAYGSPPSPARETGPIPSYPAAQPLAAPSALPENTVAAARRGAPPVPIAIDGSDTRPVPRRKPFHKRGEPEDPYEPLGIEAGAFLLRPAIELSTGYNSNPAETREPRGGAVAIVAPELRLQSNWSRHELRADLRGRFTTYPGFEAVPSLDQPNAEARVNGRIDVRHDTRIDLEGRALLSTENPNSPDLPADVAKLPIVISHGGTAGLAHRFNRLEIGLSGSLDRVEYGDSQLTDGSTVSNRDRNYNQQALKLRGAYELSPVLRPFVEIAADRRIHDLPVDAFGERRDSTGTSVSVGTSVALPARLTGSLSVGYAVRRYQDPNLPDLAGVIANGLLAWSATPLTTVTLAVRSTTDESTLPGVSGVLRRDFNVQVEHAFRQWLIATLRFGYGQDNYVGSTRVDERYSTAALLTYKLSREVQLKGEVRREWEVSNAGADYTANIFLVGVRLQR